MSEPADREHHSLYWKPLPNGFEVIVYAIFGGARVCFGRMDSSAIDDAYYYSDPMLAIVAAALWEGDGDPVDGWFRHLRSGRRRPDGDATKEYVRL
jgi:hypothetical protein